jgi:hypothetical protein
MESASGFPSVRPDRPDGRHEEPQFDGARDGDGDGDGDGDEIGGRPGGVATGARRFARAYTTLLGGALIL